MNPMLSIAVRSARASATLPLPAIFCLRRSNGLPLQVGDRVGSAAGERHDVILMYPGQAPVVRPVEGQGCCHIIPRVVVLDPAVTVHTPEWLFLSTGIRAVDHCVEGICSGEANPYGDAQALHGLSLLAYGLPRVKADPGDLAARLDCQTGSWLSMAPLASGVPMGVSHGIGYVLGTMFDIPHGHTSCIMLPAVMHWNKPANTERRALVAAAVGHPGEEAGDVLDAFIAGLGMPRSLGAVNIGAGNFDRMAEQARSTPWVPRNPRPIVGPAQVREILELAA